MNNRAQKGSVLMIALWALCTLAGFAVILGFQVRQKMVLVKRLESRNKLNAIADAAIPLGISEIKKFAKVEYMALKDSWSNDLSFKDIPVADGTCTFVRPALDPAESEPPAAYGMVDEESKVNINTADLKLLTSLMRVVLGSDVAEAQALAASLIDWRDEDSTVAIPMGSAEDAYYRNEKYPYEGKDAPFEVPDEILLVKGFNANVFEKLNNYITIYGSGRININTAGRNVLYAVGLSTLAVDKILAVRAGKDGIAGTGDDEVFTSIANVVPAITRDGGFSPTELADTSNTINDYMSVASTAFNITSVGRVPGSKDSGQVTCVIDIKGQVLAYRRQ